MAAVQQSPGSRPQRRLSPEMTARLAVLPSVDPLADESYPQGRYFWNKRTAAAYVKAFEYFDDNPL